MLDHRKWNELALLAAVGELSQEEFDAFDRHKEDCPLCRQAVAEAAATASLVYRSSAPAMPDATAVERHQRMRGNIAHYLPLSMPSAYAPRSTRWIAAGLAAALVIGVGIGAAGALRIHGRAKAAALLTAPLATAVGPAARPAALAPTTVPAQSASNPHELESLIAALQLQNAALRADYTALQSKLTDSDQRAAKIESRLGEAEKQSNARDSARDQEAAATRNALQETRDLLAQAGESARSSQTTIRTLEDKLADREARLTEVSASVTREREMLGSDREIRDIMGARDLHIVDVVDRDGRGRVCKAFGRAFYTEGKSLIFYAFDLPDKSTAGGKFVYAAWGSNSNQLTHKVTHRLGIFYNDDQTQHRWAMKFEDPKVLDEIDTVFITLEPSGKLAADPTGKPILEAYFGTPPNHP